MQLLIHPRQRLDALREQMAIHGCDYYWVPSTDVHCNEMVPACWQRRAWLSGFTGSAGDLLVGKAGGWLWVDARYTVQAAQQLLGSGLEVLHMKPGSVSMTTWLARQPAGRLRFGFDPQCVMQAQFERWCLELQGQSVDWVPLADNLVDVIWCDQPALPRQPIRGVPVSVAGLSVADKLSQWRALWPAEADCALLTQLDDIAWLLNIRGGDIVHTPVALAYCWASRDEVVLYADGLDDALRDFLRQCGVSCLDYSLFSDQIAQQVTGTILLDPQCSSVDLFERLVGQDMIRQPTIVESLKAVKTPVELAGMAQAHQYDAQAVIHTLAWLDLQCNVELTEWDVSEYLLACRSAQPGFIEPSFESICAFGPHAAIVHYAPSSSGSAAVDASNLLLLDSGGQYEFGTTDVTRTIHLGEPSDKQKRYYTAVLKGHLAVSHMQFPEGTTGAQLDALARSAIWAIGEDYGHGTGHGVGHGLCVHEGPVSLSPRATAAVLSVGMVVSNEPGVYLEHEWGIRIENVCRVEPADTLGFLRLRDLTCIPYARKLINIDQLTAQEIDWIDAYHDWVWQEMAERVRAQVRHWLRAATRPIKPVV